jgi:DNA adenine methylase
VQLKRPFLKWAGGKTKLVAAIRTAAPGTATRFVEPFVGSGTVALNLGYARNLLADSNRDLIDVYAHLQSENAAFIEACAALFTPEHNTPEAFARLRAEFNTTTDRRRRACLFVYLNRHGYNGLCRYNAKGGFNVPFGRYTRPRLPRAAMESFHAFLKDCTLRHADFRDVLGEAGAGDFVYCDPPYVPASATANFTTYAQQGFGPDDQRDLVACCRAAAQRGAWVALSNHDTPGTRALYADADECHPLLVRRRISCDAANRNHAQELLVVYRPAVGKPALPAVAAT